MMKAERQEQILRKIDANGRVVVTDYAKELGVTEATLRKDLQELDDRGLVQRVHGGAMKPDTELSRFENRVDLGKDVKTKSPKTASSSLTVVPPTIWPRKRFHATTREPSSPTARPWPCGCPTTTTSR